MNHSICKNIQEIEEDIGNTKLVVVSKYRSLEELQTVYSCGHRDFGENRVQELVDKYETLPKDINWHIIGHLQTNKVKYIAPFVHLIHSVDSLKLLKTIDKEATKAGRVIDFLFQMHIAQEETKFGLSQAELQIILESEDYTALTSVRCKGLMGMATNTEDGNQIISEFTGLKATYDKYAKDFEFDILSMGMSGDYLTALDCGSSMIRIGSKIFS